MANTNPKGLNFISFKGMVELCACLEKVPTCIKVVKASFDEELEMMPHHTIDYYPTLINPTYFGGPEMRESMQAFLEKRTPEWGKVRGRPEDF